MKTIFDFRMSIFERAAGRWLVRIAAAALAAVNLPGDAAAQGCAMCYTSASAAKKAGIEALQDGVFILLFPPLLMFGAILWYTFRRRAAPDLVPDPISLESSGR